MLADRRIALLLMVPLLLTGFGSVAPGHVAHPPTSVALARPAFVGGTNLSGAWMNISANASTAPPSRTYQSMADDPSCGCIVLFGGQSSAGKPLNDTWELTNGIWSDLTTSLSTAPSQRWGAGFVYDPSYDGLLLFGGRVATSGGTCVNDTWIFNSTGWHLLSTPVAPSPRSPYTSMVYDAHDGYVLLFGGNHLLDYRMNDTWSFSKGKWANLTSSITVAPPKYGFFAAYDPSAGRVVLYGGSTWYFPSLGETWTYRAGSWQNLTATAGGPPPAVQGSQATTYDPALGRVIVFSGVDSYGDTDQETWSFDGGNWTNLTSVVGLPPLGRWGGSLAYDPVLGGDVLFGGQQGPTGSGATLWGNDTWLIANTLRAIADANVTKGPVPFNVSFTALVGPGAGPFTFNWDFQDGPNASTLNASHLYTTPGTYHVHFEVTNSTGISAAAQLVVTAVPELSVVTRVAPGEGDPPLSVDFNATLSGGLAPLAGVWQFGDGGTSSLWNVSHQYGQAGNFSWSFTGTDAAHERRVSTGMVEVYPILSVVALTSTHEGQTPLAVDFSAEASLGDAPYAYLWQFDDGSPSVRTADASHTFTTVGTYNVSLTVSDQGGGRSQSNVVIDALSELSAGASVSPVSGQSPLSVLYSASPSGGAGPYTLRWSFGDSSGPSAATSGRHVYSNAGNYTLTLSLNDSAGDQVNTSYRVEVAAPLAVSAAVSRAAGLVPFPDTFTATTTGGLAPLSYSWTFSDGAPGTRTAIDNRSITSPGNLTALVTVTSRDGASAHASVTVHAAAPVSLSVTGTSGTVDVGSTVELAANASGGFPPWTYVWTGLPPGCASSSASSDACAPSARGVYVVNVTATDSAGDRVSGTWALEVLPAPSNSPVLVDLGLATAGVAVIVAAYWIVRRRRASPPES